MTEIYNIRSRSVPSDAVNIMRPGPWGNPFEEKEYGREGCIALYEHWLFLNPTFVSRMRRELRNKDLVCCCWPKPCHGNVIAKILGGEEPAPLRADDPVLLRYLGSNGDRLAELLRQVEKLVNDPFADRPKLEILKYQRACIELIPHLRRITASRQELWPKPQSEKVEVSREDLIAWRAEWLETQQTIAEQEPGVDIVTPFDHYLYGSKP